MALPSTVRRFHIELSDVDRGVYESIDQRVAQHPSETDAYLVTRVLAFALNYEEGIVFSKGVSTPDEPTISVRDATGRILRWIEIGDPSSERLHKASKAADDVSVYCHKNVDLFLKKCAGKKIHRADEIKIFDVPKELVADFPLDRDNIWSLTRTDGQLYLSTEGKDFSGTLPAKCL